MRIIELDSCGSTNDEAWARQDGAPTLVVAQMQHSGRGRLGRRWESEKTGNLYTSLWLPAPTDHTWLALLPLAAGVAAAETIMAFWPQCDEKGLRLKWPNDLMINNAKCGGLLCEARWSSGKMTGMVAGLGLNLEHVPELSGGRVVTALRAEGFQGLTAPALWAETWAANLMRWVATIAKQNEKSLLQRWEELAHLDAFPLFETHEGGALRRYQAMGLDLSGRLRVRDMTTMRESTLDQAP